MGDHQETPHAVALRPRSHVRGDAFQPTCQDPLGIAADEAVAQISVALASLWDSCPKLRASKEGS